APWNEDRPAAMALLERGSTFTLYGGAGLTSWVAGPSSRGSTSSALALSRHRRRGRPKSHRAAGWGEASAGGLGMGPGVGSLSELGGSRSRRCSSAEKPVRLRSKSIPCSWANYNGSLSSSQCDSVAV